MIDCGEGTQMQLVKCGFRQGKLRHVFISHSHGDHCLGLVPMLSSFALEGRSYDLNIYASSDLIEFLQNQISFFIHNASFEIIFHSIDCQHPTVIYTDAKLKASWMRFPRAVVSIFQPAQSSSAMPSSREMMG